jgi:hypothetical protein
MENVSDILREKQLLESPRVYSLFQVWPKSPLENFLWLILRKLTWSVYDISHCRTRESYALLLIENLHDESSVRRDRLFSAS